MTTQTNTVINGDVSITKAVPFVEKAVLALSVIGTVFTVGWLLWLSRYGFEFTDEGYYLVWMANPFNYSVSGSQFGFIYYPLYELLDGNIVRLRQANILITFGLAWGFFNILFKSVLETRADDATRRLIVSAAFATSSLVFLSLWLPTPNYNGLALQALLIGASGLLWAEKTVTRTSVIGWLLLAVGGWLAFMAKPTTAAAFGIAAGVYLLLAGKFSLRLAAISLVTAVGLLLVSAIAIDGSIPGFIDRLKGGVEMGRALGGGHTFTEMLRVDRFDLNAQKSSVLLGSMVVFAAAAYFFQTQIRTLSFGAALLSSAFVFFGLAIIGGYIRQPLVGGSFQGLLITAVPLACIVVLLVLSRFSLQSHITKAQAGLALVFLVLPHIFAFGTNNNYWSTGANAGIFWVTAGVILLGRAAPAGKVFALLLPLGLATQLTTVALIAVGIEAPYRQSQRLSGNDYPIEIGRPGSELLLSKGYGLYLSEAIGIANKAGFKKGAPMIDLTGQSPGVLYALGASNIGQAWTAGGYPGSSKLAEAMLTKVSCEKLGTAWLLVEPDGPRKIDLNVLKSFGANITTDFEAVGVVKTAAGAGGYAQPRLQELYKPVRSSSLALSSCAAVRASKP